MKKDCIDTENTIWDSLAEGTQIPEDVLGHARQCPECSRVLAEASQSLKLLHCAGAYPEAPDCRSAVMSRITARSWTKSVRRFAWVGVPVAAVVAAGLILPMKPTPAPEAVRVARVLPRADVRANASATPHVSRTSSRNTVSTVTSAKPPKAVRSAPRVQEPRSATPRRTAPRRRPIREIEKMAAVPYGERDVVAMALMDWQDSARTYRDQPDTTNFYAMGDFSTSGWEADGDDNAVVEAVSVNWSADADTENVTHRFIEKDDATGTVTMGSVKRTGDTIEIEMESTPPAELSPVKGEISDEKSPSV